MTEPWWRSAVVYEVYPRSFQDSDGDGVGDLKGIGQRLDYLAWLGVDAVWIAPFYPSPMADFGYDVADYCGVDPLFGTMEDFDRLLAARPRARAEGAGRLRAQPHLRPASVVHRVARLARQPEARLVRLARPQARRLAAQQLAVDLRRPGLVARRRGGRAVVPALLPRQPARPRTGATPRSRRRCWRPWPSGSIAASTASGSTPCGPR